MAWPIAGSEPGSLGVDWARDVEGAKSVLENTTCFKSPAGKFLPVLLDLYNGQRMMLPVDGALVPLHASGQCAYDLATAQDSFAEARDAACEALKGQKIAVKLGPRARATNHVRAVMLRAMVVDERQQILFEMDSTI
ncbi:MAG: hypothetical protein AAB480_04950 [Patescibacteria group bacterium]